MNRSWKDKISSRKFWALLGAVILAIMGLFNSSAFTMEQTSLLISAIGACVCYMFAEGSVDKACQKQQGKNR